MQYGHGNGITQIHVVSMFFSDGDNLFHTFRTSVGEVQTVSGDQHVRVKVDPQS